MTIFLKIAGRLAIAGFMFWLFWGIAKEDIAYAIGLIGAMLYLLMLKLNDIEDSL